MLRTWVPDVPRRQTDRGAVAPAYRSSRRTVRLHRDAVGPGTDGRILIRAVVHARLLGLHLLTLDARVVLTDAEMWASDWQALRSDEDGHTRSRREPALGPARGDIDGDVDTARALLAESVETLNGRRSTETSPGRNLTRPGVTRR